MAQDQTFLLRERHDARHVGHIGNQRGRGVHQGFAFTLDFELRAQVLQFLDSDRRDLEQTVHEETVTLHGGDATGRDMR